MYSQRLQQPSPPTLCSKERGGITSRIISLTPLRQMVGRLGGTGRGVLDNMFVAQLSFPRYGINFALGRRLSHAFDPSPPNGRALDGAKDGTKQDEVHHLPICEP